MNYIQRELGLTEGEAIVSDYINAIGLYWHYEQAVYLLDDKGRPRIWTPDFYISDMGVHVEVVGNSSLSNYDWRKEIYAANKVPIIFVYVFENKNWKDDLLAELKAIHEARIVKLKNIEVYHARSKEKELKM